MRGSSLADVALQRHVMAHRGDDDLGERLDANDADALRLVVGSREEKLRDERPEERQPDDKVRIKPKLHAALYLGRRPTATALAALY